jgi:hypothetical protein
MFFFCSSIERRLYFPLVVTIIDTSRFPVGRDIDYESEDEAEAIRALTAQADAYVESYRWMRPVEKVTLAFGVRPLLGLYLIRFTPGGKPEDRERWLVVGDFPAMNFETDDTPEPWLALKLYCAIAQDWADNVRDGRDLSDSYPIEIAPTAEHAQMLLDRIAFIRNEIIPLAG